MYHLTPGEPYRPRQNLLHEGECLGRGQASFQSTGQVALAELGDDVGVVLGSEDLVKSEDVGQSFEFSENLHFAFEQDAVDIILEGAQIDDLDGHGLSGVIMTAAEDLT